MCGQPNVRVTTKDSTGQNTDKRDTPSPSMKTEIFDLAENRTWATGLEFRQIKIYLRDIFCT